MLKAVRVKLGWLILDDRQTARGLRAGIPRQCHQLADRGTEGNGASIIDSRIGKALIPHIGGPVCGCGHFRPYHRTERGGATHRRRQETDEQHPGEMHMWVCFGCRWNSARGKTSAARHPLREGGTQLAACCGIGGLMPAAWAETEFGYWAPSVCRTRLASSILPSCARRRAWEKRAKGAP